MKPIVTIREASLSDLPAITEIYNEAILLTKATFDLEPKTAEEQFRWFNAHGGKYPVFVAVVEGKVVGWSSLSRYSDRCAYDGAAETSFYVKSEFQGQGIGRKLNDAIIAAARRLNFHTLVARIAEGSDASVHLNKSAGFVHVGTLKKIGRKFDQLLDVHILQKMLD